MRDWMWCNSRNRPTYLHWGFHQDTGGAAITRRYWYFPLFLHFNNKLIWPHLEYIMQACLPNLVTNADCLERIQRFCEEVCEGFPLTAIYWATTPAGCALLKMMSSPQQCVFRRIGSGPQPLFFTLSVRQDWEGILSKVRRVLIGAYAESRPSQYDVLRSRTGSSLPHCRT